MIKCFFLVLLSPIYIFCQNIEANTKGQGIIFAKSNDWSEQLKLAKGSNKFIFIDCYATWCGQCKKMKRDVYGDSSVGIFFNKYFISMEMQIDTSKNDDTSVKKLYAQAKYFRDKFNITTLPSLLFFSSDGELVHKIVGYQDINSLLTIASQALNPKEQNYYQYFKMREIFESGKFVTMDLPFLIRKANDLMEYNVESAAFEKYTSDYLQIIPQDSVLNKNNLDLILSQIGNINVTDYLFSLFCKNGRLIDSIYSKPGFTKSIVSSIFVKAVVKNDILKIIDNDIEPNWIKQGKVVERLVGKEYANHNLNFAKEIWYQKHNRPEKYTEYLIQRVEGQVYEQHFDGLSGILYWNNIAWQIFQNSQDKRKLEKALQWIENGINLDKTPNVAMLDTKANILYKIGNRKEAIQIMREARPLNKEYIDPTLKKMELGLPTWTN